MDFEILMKPIATITSIDFEVLTKSTSTGISFLFYFLILSIIKFGVTKFGKKQKYLEIRVIYVKKFFVFFLFSILFVVVTFIWGIDIRGVLIFASSFFALIGVALFASWSVLSNITAGIIIFFSFPYKIGDEIKIIDGDNSIEGEIIDMTLFHIQIKEINENTTTCPNNLAIQKAISKLHQNLQ